LLVRNSSDIEASQCDPTGYAAASIHYVDSVCNP
jgi:hypothetical protein